MAWLCNWVLSWRRSQRAGTEHDLYLYQRHRDREAEKVINSYRWRHSTAHFSHASPEWLISLRERKTYRERPSKPNESACYSTQLTENMNTCSGLLQPASIIQIYVNLTKLAKATHHPKCKIIQKRKETTFCIKKIKPWGPFRFFSLIKFSVMKVLLIIFDSNSHHCHWFLLDPHYCHTGSHSCFMYIAYNFFFASIQFLTA